MRFFRVLLFAMMAMISAASVSSSSGGSNSASSISSEKADSFRPRDDVAIFSPFSLWDWPFSRSQFSPFYRMNEMMKALNKMDQELELPTQFSSPLSLDVKETDKSYEVQVDIPGVPEDKISLSITDNILTITTERKGMTKEEGDNFKRIERYSGHSSRSITLPKNVDEDKISASSKDGVLHIMIPKLVKGEKECGRKIEIEHK